MPPADVVQVAARLADQRWRLNNLYRITDEQGQDVVFSPNWAQRSLYNDMHTYNLILKARQLGITTFISLLALDLAIFNPNFSAGFITYIRGEAEVIFRGKIRRTYDKLPEAVQRLAPIVKETASEVEFANGSSIRVGQSFRGGTLRLLHVSELGKIATKFPEKAKEIVTGAFGAVHAGGNIFVESTAEGRGGAFYEMVKRAQADRDAEKKPGPLDFKLFFYPWWKNPSYQLPPPPGFVAPEHISEYRGRLLKEEGIELSPEQVCWYSAKEKLLGDDMLREYPATEDEAFDAAVEGAFYAKEIAAARREKRIGKVAYEPDLPVHTGWDLGVDDATSIWFFQVYRREVRFIDYLEDSGEGLAYYARMLQERKYVFGEHYAPHDIRVREMGTGKTRLAMASALGINFQIAPKLAVADGVEQVRTLLVRASFDEEKCEKGLAALQNYRREWDEKLGVYKPRPLHDWASNGADAMRIVATGMKPPEDPRPTSRHAREQHPLSWMAS